MNARLVILWAVSMGVSLAMLVPAWRGAAAAANQMKQAQAELAETERLAAELADLRANLPTWAANTGAPETSESVAQSLTRVLGDAGSPTAALSSVTPGSVITFGGTSVIGLARPERVRHTAVLEPILLPQLGRVLERWRIARPEWTVVAVDLSPLRAEGVSKATRKGAPLRASVTLETIRAGSPPATQ